MDEEATKAEQIIHDDQKFGRQTVDGSRREDALDRLLWVMADPSIRLIDEYAPNVYGLDMPVRLLWEAYVVRVDIGPEEGWETGRESQPAYMDMNLHSLRAEGTNFSPKVVLYQYDRENPMNPNGLLMSYQEKEVKPVVSDMDLFLIGAKGC
jgi:hypothetical protein